MTSEEKWKKYKNVAIIGFLGFLILVILYSLLWGPAKKYGDSLMSVRSVNVSAEGKVTVSPDIAKLSFSVVSEGKNPKSLAEDNNEKMKAAIDFVKSEGIEEKDVKTTDYNLSPRYEYDEETRKSFISGYTLTQTVLVKIRDLNKVSEILAGLPGLGINQIGSIYFDIDDQEKYLAEARSQAFDKAREKAKTMAKDNKVRLGKAITFSEYHTLPYPYYAETKSVLGMGGAADSAVAAPRIEPGSQEVTVQVNVTYKIR